MDSIIANKQREVVRQLVRTTNGHELVYCVTCSELRSDELGQFTSFGLEILDRSTDTYANLDDISPDCDAVLRFAKLCFDLEVFPEQLHDAAENFLAQLYGPPSKEVQ